LPVLRAACHHRFFFISPGCHFQDIPSFRAAEAYHDAADIFFIFAVSSPRRRTLSDAFAVSFLSPIVDIYYHFHDIVFSLLIIFISLAEVTESLQPPYICFHFRRNIFAIVFDIE
jgi:hypothetical protein